MYKKGDAVAVDVAILPPAAVLRRAIAANRCLPNSDLRLGTRRNVPHLTLGMACLRRDDLERLRQELRALAAASAALHLKLTSIAGVTGATGNVNAWYHVSVTPALRRLHAGVMASLAGFPRARLTSRALVLRPRQRPSPSTRVWIEGFDELAAGPRFRPHITLGRGTPAPETGLPLAFRATRLAVCQLGNHCTCARVLFESRLRG